jgi:hypothetical protein
MLLYHLRGYDDCHQKNKGAPQEKYRAPYPAAATPQLGRYKFELIANYIVERSICKKARISV